MSLPLTLALLIGACYLAWLLMNRMLAIRAELRDLDDAMRESDKRMAEMFVTSSEVEQSQDE